jgi:hypothetical protein
VFRIPSRRKLVEKGRPWTPLPGVHQTSVPRDPQLIEKLGMKKGERVFVFAGSYGEWASELAKHTKLFYTDLSKGMVERAKHMKGIKRAKVRDAAFAPQARRVYDWSFSFEPLSLKEGHYVLALVRSLLNNKGAKIVFCMSPLPTGPVQYFVKITEHVANLYGASVECKHIDVRCKDRVRGHLVLTLATDEVARARAWHDLRLMKALDKMPHATTSQLARKLGITPKQVKESLSRLEALSRYVQQELLKEVKVVE